MGILIQTPLVIGPETVGAAEMSSGNADAGDVLTADGAGGAAWQAPQGGGGGPAEWIAWISQDSNEGEITIVELKNTLGAVTVQQPAEEVYYEVICNGAFAEGYPKVRLAGYDFPATLDGPAYANVYIIDSSTIKLACWNGNPVSGDMVTPIKMHVHLQVYP